MNTRAAKRPTLKAGCNSQLLFSIIAYIGELEMESSPGGIDPLSTHMMRIQELTISLQTHDYHPTTYQE